LQMLVENAFKHNLLNEKKQLKIEIFDEQKKFIVVRNNFIRKPELLKIGNNLIDRPQNENSHKIGLKNIRKRYQYFADKNIEITCDDFFTVKLPVINNNIEN
jgi:two-component system, LytTR family, sensor kinase